MMDSLDWRTVIKAGGCPNWRGDPYAWWSGAWPGMYLNRG